MKIIQHTEGYDVVMDATESLEILVNDASAKKWIVADGKEAQVSIRFKEDEVETA